jgi:hypothetical protein
VVFWWCDGGLLMRSGKCSGVVLVISGGVLLVFWCSLLRSGCVLMLFWWCSGVLVVFWWHSGGVLEVF